MTGKPVRLTDIGRLYSLIMARFDRLEAMLTTKSGVVGDELLNSRNVRILTKMSDRTLLRRRKDGSLPFFRQGGKIYYLKSDVLRALQEPDRESKSQIK